MEFGKSLVDNFAEIICLNPSNVDTAGKAVSHRATSEDIEGQTCRYITCSILQGA